MIKELIIELGYFVINEWQADNFIERSNTLIFNVKTNRYDGVVTIIQNKNRYNLIIDNICYENLYSDMLIEAIHSKIGDR